MRFTPNFSTNCAPGFPVSEVVGRRVKFEEAGREFKGLSPFQQEKSPSFTVNDQKGFYHELLLRQARRHHLVSDGAEASDSPKAVERLAGMAGHGAPGGDAGCGKARAAPQTLYDVMDLAAKFFCDTLGLALGAKARAISATAPSRRRRNSSSASAMRGRAPASALR